MQISLIKKLYLEQKDNIYNSIENNIDNRNSINFTRKFEYKFNPINNKNRKTKSFLEETEKNNNQSINEKNKIQDNIIKENETKHEKIGRKRFIFKKIQKNDSNKELKKIYTNTNLNIKREKYLFNKYHENPICNTPFLNNNKKENINDENNDYKPININKRKNNRFLNKNNKENTKSLLEKNKNEENVIQINLGKSFIKSKKSILQNINTDNNINNLTKSVNDLNKLKEQKNQNNINKLNNNKILINNRSFIFKSDKVNQFKTNFKNYNYKVVNSQNNNIQQKNINEKDDKKEDIKTDRQRIRAKILKKYKVDKNNLDNTYQNNEIANLTNTNINKGNPFKDKINYNQIKSINNRYGNHKYHEIKSTSCEKDNNLILNHKDKNHISHQIENKQPSHLIISSMDNLKLFKNEIISEKSLNNNNKLNKNETLK